MVKRIDAEYDHSRGVNDTHTQWTEDLSEYVTEDLTSVNGITLTLFAPDGTKALDAVSASAVDTDTVGYTFASGDVSQQGGHQGYFTIDHGTDDDQRVPNNGNFVVQVIPDDQL